MAVAATLLGSLADSVDRNSYTVSITPAADRLLLVYAGYTAPSSPSAPPSLSGNNIAIWSLVDDDHATARGLSLHVAKTGASPSSGSLTLSFSGVTQTHCIVAVIEIDGADLSGTALDAILQSIDDAQAAVTSRSVSLPSAPGDGSRCFSGWMIELDEPITPRTNWTELRDAGHGGPNRRLEVQWRSNVSEQTGSASWTNSTTVHSIVAEVKLAASTVALTPAELVLAAVALDPVPQPVTVSLTAATVALAVVAVTPEPQPVTVTLTPATITLSAPEVTILASVDLTAVDLVLAAVTVDPVPQPVEITLTAVDLVLTAVEVVPTPASSEITLTAAAVTLEAVATDPVGQPVTVDLTAATVMLAGVELDPEPQPITVTLTVATVAITGIAVTPVPQPITISLTVATFAFSAPALSAVPQPVQIALTPAVLTLAGVSVTAVPGLVTMTLTPAVLTLIAVVALQRDANPRRVTYTEPSYAVLHQDPTVTYQDPADLVYQEG